MKSKIARLRKRRKRFLGIFRTSLLKSNRTLPGLQYASALSLSPNSARIKRGRLRKLPHNLARLILLDPPPELEPEL